MKGNVFASASLLCEDASCVRECGTTEAKNCSNTGTPMSIPVGRKNEEGSFKWVRGPPQGVLQVRKAHACDFSDGAVVIV